MLHHQSILRVPSVHHQPLKQAYHKLSTGPAFEWSLTDHLMPSRDNQLFLSLPREASLVVLSLQLLQLPVLLLQLSLQTLYLQSNKKVTARWVCSVPTTMDTFRTLYSGHH